MPKNLKRQIKNVSILKTSDSKMSNKKLTKMCRSRITVFDPRSNRFAYLIFVTFYIDRNERDRTERYQSEDNGN